MKTMTTMTKIPTIGMSQEDWLAERRKSLGGSDIGAVLGLNKYSSPYAVWAEKTGRLPPKEDNEAMRQGRDLEQYVAERFSERSGKAVQKYNYLLRSDAAPYLHANIDRRIVGEKSGLECKTSSALNLRAYSSGEFPESYYAQCVDYLAVTGWERWYLAALVLNKAFYIYQVTTIQDDTVPEWCESSVYVSPGEINTLKQCAVEFWKSYIITDTPPPADGATATGDAIQSIYARDDGGSIELFGRDELLKEYFSLSEERQTIQQRMDVIRQELQQDMGEASKAVCAAATVTWRAQERRAFDVKSFQKAYPEICLDPFYKRTTSRVFKINPAKERT